MKQTVRRKASKRIPIFSIKELVSNRGYTSAVLVAYNKDTKETCVASWGNNKDSSKEAAAGASKIKEILGFSQEKVNIKPKI